ncbi:MAG: prepilin-type N-terminal cleavage/methylation domain-containing protein [Minisyncoccota bacterium]
MIKINKKGFSIMEMLIYLAILALMLWVIANILNSMIQTERVASSSKVVENAAIFGLERIVREVRDASAVESSSVLDLNPGVLVLSGTDTNGGAKTIEFFINLGALHIKENGIDKGALTESKATVTDLVFSVLSNPNSKSVKTVMTVESGTSTTYKKETFYSTTILRGSL